MIHHTKLSDVALHGKAQLAPGIKVGTLPLLDNANRLPITSLHAGKRLFARLNYDEHAEAAEALGGRMPTVHEHGSLRANGLHLKPFLGTPRAENDIIHSRRHDENVYEQLAQLGWDGQRPVAGAGKGWAAGAPPGKSFLVGWDKDGSGPSEELWQPAQVAHNRAHFDDGTTSTVVFDEDDDPLFRKAKRTGETMQMVAEALKRQWPSASRSSLLVLLAHWGLETDNGRACWNHNLGNIKRIDGEPWTVLANVPEVINGKVVTFQRGHIQTMFRAFDSLDDGAAAYLDMLRNRFAIAWPSVEAGDAVMFGIKLKEGRYYTADAGSYSKLLHQRVQQFNASLPKVVSGGAKEPQRVGFLGRLFKTMLAISKRQTIYYSHGYRCSVRELVEDAQALGLYHKIGGTYVPKVGDLVISERAGGNPERGGNGHVERISGIMGKLITTIGGNESNMWVEEPLTAPGVIGYIDVCSLIGERAVEVARAEMKAGVREKPGPLAHPRIQAYHAGTRRGGSAVAGMPGAINEGVATLGKDASDEIAWCASGASLCAFEAAQELEAL